MWSNKLVGVKWDLESDTFGFRLKIKDKPFTRRGIPSIVSSVYDSVEFSSSFVLPAKGVLQDLCRKGLGWDELVLEESV